MFCSKDLNNNSKTHDKGSKGTKNVKNVQMYLQYSRPDITSLKLLQASSSVKGFSVGISRISPFSSNSKTKNDQILDFRSFVIALQG